MPSSLAPLPPAVPDPSTSSHSHSSPVSVSASASASTSTHSQTHSNHGNRPSSSSAPSPPSPETARQITEARTALNASIQNIFTPHEHAFKLRAQNLHQNSAALTKQENDLKKEIGKLGKEGDKLEKLVREGQKRVKELGNVQNWAEVLERDFLVVGEVLRLVDGRSDSEGWSESEWSDDEDGGRAGKRGGVQERGAGLDGSGGEDRNDIDTHMSGVVTNDDTSIHDTNCMHPNGNGKGKEKEIEEEMDSSEHMEVMDTEESSMSRNASNSEPSSSSIRTSASGMS